MLDPKELFLEEKRKELETKLSAEYEINENITPLPNEKTCMYVPVTDEMEKAFNKMFMNSDETYKVMPNFIERMKYLQLGDLNLSLSFILDTVYEIIKEEKDLFYGVIVIDADGNKFNLLHPYNAKLLYLNDVNMKSEEYSAILLARNKSLIHEDTLSSLSLQKIKSFLDEIDLIVSVPLSDSLDFPVSIKPKYDLSKNIPNKIYLEKYSLSYKKDPTDNNLYLLSDIEDSNNIFYTPNHLFSTGGLVYPYYGNTYGLNGLAWTLGPTTHVNVSTPDVHSPLIDGEVQTESSICTHSGNPSTLAGFSALNYSNYDSPRNKRVFFDSFFAWSTLNMISSFELFGLSTRTEILKDIFDIDISSFEIKLSEYISFNVFLDMFFSHIDSKEDKIFLFKQYSEIIAKVLSDNFTEANELLLKLFEKIPPFASKEVKNKEKQDIAEKENVTNEEFHLDENEDEDEILF